MDFYGDVMEQRLKPGKTLEEFEKRAYENLNEFDKEIKLSFDVVDSF